MTFERTTRVLVHWQTWMDIGGLALAVGVLSIVLNASNSRETQNMLHLAFPSAVACFFIGFLCLLWQQRTNNEGRDKVAE